MADSKCVVASAAGTRSKSACRHEASTGRARLQLLDRVRRRLTCGACLSLPPALVWKNTCRLVARPAVCLCTVHWSCHEALTGRASLWLLDGMRGGDGLKVHAPPCHWHSSVKCLPPRPAACSVVCKRDAMKLRLVEQACSCSTVRGGDGLKSACASLPPALVWRVLAATTSRLQFGLQRKPP